MKFPQLSGQWVGSRTLDSSIYSTGTAKLFISNPDFREAYKKQLLNRLNSLKSFKNNNKSFEYNFCRFQSGGAHGFCEKEAESCLVVVAYYCSFYF